jgi:hypothetical protein
MRSLLSALAVLVAAALPARAQAQNVCSLVYQQGNWTSTGAEGQRVLNAGGPLLVRCANGEELRADSAVIFEAINETHMFGRVDYQDPGRSLTSDYATYNGTSGRLYATGNVVFTDKARGSTLRGPNLEYFRAAAGRPEAQAIATERPHLTVVPRSGAGRDPMEVDGDRITTVGEKFVTAEGNVVITGKTLNARAQEAYYDATAERMELRRDAWAKGEQYELTGDFIETQLAQGALQQVLSRGNARLVQERMRITGPQLQLYFQRDSLQRLVSGRTPSSSGRSVALARGFRMEADSLEALTPGQRLRQVRAIGTATGQAWDTLKVVGPGPADAVGAPDTVAGLALGERDLLFADTIIGFFRDSATAGRDSAPAGRRPAARDTTQNAELERMLAMGRARSLYRMQPGRDSTGQVQRRADGKLPINYLIGDTIDLAFAGGEVDVATVRGLKRGVYLDPAPERADSAGRDSAAAARGAAGDSAAAGRPAAPAGTPAPTVSPAQPAQRPAPRVLGAPATPAGTAPVRRGTTGVKP